MTKEDRYTLVEFLEARIAEDEAIGRDWQRHPSKVEVHGGGTGYLRLTDPARVLAECAAKRRIVELHRSWPVLVQQSPRMEQVSGGDPNLVTFRASQEIMWLTEQEYRAKFGDEPPAAPMLRALAVVYADHPDYDDSWRAVMYDVSVRLI